MLNNFSDETKNLMQRDMMELVSSKAIINELKSRDVPQDAIDRAINLIKSGKGEAIFKARCNTREEEVRRDTSGAEIINYDYRNDTTSYCQRQYADIPVADLLPVEQRLENDIQRSYAEVDASLEAAGEMIEMVNEYQQSIDVIMRDLFIS